MRKNVKTDAPSVGLLVSGHTIFSIAAEDSPAIRASSCICQIFLNALLFVSRGDDLSLVIGQLTARDQGELFVCVIALCMSVESRINCPALIPGSASFAGDRRDISAIESSPLPYSEF